MLYHIISKILLTHAELLGVQFNFATIFFFLCLYYTESRSRSNTLIGRSIGTQNVPLISSHDQGQRHPNRFTGSTLVSLPHNSVMSVEIQTGTDDSGRVPTRSRIPDFPMTFQVKSREVGNLHAAHFVIPMKSKSASSQGWSNHEIHVS